MSLSGLDQLIFYNDILLTFSLYKILRTLSREIKNKSWTPSNNKEGKKLCQIIGYLCEILVIL